MVTIIFTVCITGKILTLYHLVITQHSTLSRMDHAFPFLFRWLSTFLSMLFYLFYSNICLEETCPRLTMELVWNTCVPRLMSSGWGKKILSVTARWSYPN
ncbi:hypothetical protein NPIL_319491 [Nephila pilipes]|uniref:Uncharacterized protein n=1 Tax=Nephila pilipes TaxID=299642 RepID=A0A8X6N265_NEPPI|nr:hypothetical protein NPIL_319491 [Nephila pilipes]